MGFRSTFVTQDHRWELPEWFVEKYRERVNFCEGNKLPISSKFEAKTYWTFEDLEKDIQKALAPALSARSLVLVWLHECGGITRAEINDKEIVYTEPYPSAVHREDSAWMIVPEPTHYYCYGCSDASLLYNQL